MLEQIKRDRDNNNADENHLETHEKMDEDHSGVNSFFVGGQNQKHLT